MFFAPHITNSAVAFTFLSRFENGNKKSSLEVTNDLAFNSVCGEISACWSILKRQRDDLVQVMAVCFHSRCIVGAGGWFLPRLINFQTVIGFVKCMKKNVTNKRKPDAWGFRNTTKYMLHLSKAQFDSMPSAVQTTTSVSSASCDAVCAWVWRQ